MADDDHRHSTSVAVLGTGIMGAAMARNLCRAGLDVRVWNRTRAKAEPLAEQGARVEDTPARAVAGADVVMTMLHDASAVEAAMRPAAGAFTPGAVWAQCSTAGLDALPGFADYAHQQGLTFVDSPVLGTRQPAEAGALVVLAAGPPEVRDRLSPVFTAIGSRTLWAGDEGAQGAATRLKLVCNSWVLTVTNGVAEALALARGLGVNPQDFLDVIAEGTLDMGYLRIKAAAILNEDLAPSFTVAGARKDAELIVGAATSAGVRLDVAQAGAKRFQRASEQGHGDQDMAATYYASWDT